VGKRTDIQSILVIGSGPIVIGQACEFDYSGTQACKALKSDGYRVILVNSNPATIMTDPEIADRTYVEPLLPKYLERIIAYERPDAMLPTVGGQTALNLALELDKLGILEKYKVKLLGAQIEAVKIAEDRQMFKNAMDEIGIESPKSGIARSEKEAGTLLEYVGLPAIIRPSFTLGGSGGGIAYNTEEYEEIVQRGLSLSPIQEILVEESVIGWKEFELEVMRDKADNFVVICSIENFDPMGVHTGDSITVAPVQTLSDYEYQIMRDAAKRIIRKVGVETGGSNIQFAVNPENGRLVVIEMNPRVSRSSALASKATGFPIAKIAAKLAVGYTLDEIPNDITLKTPASFEPSIDYVVVKIPKWNFEKFPEAKTTLGTQMKSVGEVMAIGSTFKHAFMKALQSLEIDKSLSQFPIDPGQLQLQLRHPGPDRLAYLRYALLNGMSVEEVYDITKIDRWFLRHLLELFTFSQDLGKYAVDTIPSSVLRKAKEWGISDIRLSNLLKTNENEIRHLRNKYGILPVYKHVDTCAAEFESYTPYYYSTYDTENEVIPGNKKKIMILGSGPNRIGQGIEFDYCCCHASFALKSDGYETIMVNCNPETVSTDYDTSDRLYFEPLTFENVLNIIELEKPDGVIVQFGGQTPLKLAVPLHNAGVPIIGTSPDSIDLAEDRKRFGAFLRKHNITHPEYGTAHSFEEARGIAESIGFPVLVRPSYVLGGRAMQIVYDDTTLHEYMEKAVDVSSKHPVLIDKYLEDAFEYDVDAVADGKDVIIGGIMQHIEEAGIHSGDSSCVLPPIMITEDQRSDIIRITRLIARELNVIGLMNIQFAIKDGIVYVLEVNPRASRTVPFVSKATGVPLAKIAAQVMAGRTLSSLGFDRDLTVHNYYVKSPVFPFNKFQGVDTILGPEMKSTGEVMGSGATFGEAFLKAQESAGLRIPDRGTVFVSINDRDKEKALGIVKQFTELGFSIIATKGTSEYFNKNGVASGFVYKVNEGRPNVVDIIKNGKIQIIINTPLGKKSFFDEKALRRAAIQYNIPCITTLSGTLATVGAIQILLNEKNKPVSVTSLQEAHSIRATHLPVRRKTKS
jgi:carbamoyl-phosphate synthase large subunit